MLCEWICGDYAFSHITAEVLSTAHHVNHRGGVEQCAQYKMIAEYFKLRLMQVGRKCRMLNAFQ